MIIENLAQLKLFVPSRPLLQNSHKVRKWVHWEVFISLDICILAKNVLDKKVVTQ